ncbi:MAG: hypothetical protein AB7D36_02430 [Oscillospiraceae bacterium]
MKIKPYTAIIIVLAIFIAGIAITSAIGLWSTKSNKTPAKLTESEFSGEYDPADIRGSYTFSEISSLFNVPIEDLSAAFGFDEDDASTFKCKDLESIYGESEYEIGTGSVRMFVAYYLGLPYEPSEETFLTDTAVQILTEQGNLSEAQQRYLDDHTLPAA